MSNNHLMRPRAMSASSNGSFNDTSRKYPGQGQGSSKNIPCRHWMNKVSVYNSNCFFLCVFVSDTYTQ